MTAVTIFVPEISCDTCKTAIEGALRPLPGVREASVDVGAREVLVHFDESAITRDVLNRGDRGAGLRGPGQ